MTALDDRLSRLRRAYPEAPFKALLRIPAGFDREPAKAQAFIRTWTAAQELASMIEWRVAGLARTYREPFPGMLGPNFKELAEGHSAAFLRQIETAASQDGTVSKKLLYGAFDAGLEKVRGLEMEVKQRHASQGEGVSQGRRGRSR